jgi:hypothetical protein
LVANLNQKPGNHLTSSRTEVQTMAAKWIGMMEGLLRDRMLAGRIPYSTPYNAEDMRKLFLHVLHSFSANARIFIKPREACIDTIASRRARACVISEGERKVPGAYSHNEQGCNPEKCRQSSFAFT